MFVSLVGFVEIGEYFAQHPDERLGHVLDGELAPHVYTVGSGADSAVPEDPQLSVTLQILFAYYNFATAVFHPEVVQDVVGVVGQVGLDVAGVPGNYTFTITTLLREGNIFTHCLARLNNVC